MEWNCQENNDDWLAWCAVGVLKDFSPVSNVNSCPDLIKVKVGSNFFAVKVSVVPSPADSSWPENWLGLQTVVPHSDLNPWTDLESQEELAHPLFLSIEDKEMGRSMANVMPSSDGKKKELVSAPQMDQKYVKSSKVGGVLSEVQDPPVVPQNSAEVQDPPVGQQNSAEVQDPPAGQQNSAEVQDPPVGIQNSPNVQDPPLMAQQTSKVLFISVNYV
ncbi:hypothetical protein Q3G72_003027 [Acer saccharum]|nr:hypothetical protein Q3G72_003027 [Acer saccharum]